MMPDPSHAGGTLPRGQSGESQANDAPTWRQLFVIFNGIMGEVCVLAALNGGWFWLPAWWLRLMAWVFIAVGSLLLLTGLVLKAIVRSGGDVV